MSDEDLTAWAAGLFDGEGSSSMFVPRSRRSARRQIQVSQAGSPGSLPEVLVKFREIVGCGSITGPYRGYLYYWKTTKSDLVDDVAALLWPFLSAPKRDQFANMSRAAGCGVPAVSRMRPRRSMELAWAAGLFDGEGSIFLSGPPRWPSVTLEISQAGVETPETLERFRAAVSVGSVNGPYPPRSQWSRAPSYRWRVSGRHVAGSVLGSLWPWLSNPKKQRALSFANRLDAHFVGLSEPSERSSSM